MALSVYRSARATPRGTTTSTAPHPRHRYRRASTVLDSGPASGSSGPSTSRLRRPWPTTRSGLPGSRLAAPQQAQLAGRTAAHDGGAFAQNLTSIADWIMRVSLRWIACNRLRRSAAGERWVQSPPATFLSGPHAQAFSPGAPPTTSAARRARNVHARRGRRPYSRPETHHSACARSRRDPSATLRGNKWGRCVNAAER